MLIALIIQPPQRLVKQILEFSPFFLLKRNELSNFLEKL